MLQEHIAGLQSKGYSLRQIARETGLTASTISRLARGLVAPDVGTVELILGLNGYKLVIVKQEE